MSNPWKKGFIVSLSTRQKSAGIDPPEARPSAPSRHQGQRQLGLVLAYFHTFLRFKLKEAIPANPARLEGDGSPPLQILHNLFLRLLNVEWPDLLGGGVDFELYCRPRRCLDNHSLLFSGALEHRPDLLLGPAFMLWVFWPVFILWRHWWEKLEYFNCL